jgi:hypothetical protein
MEFGNNSRKVLTMTGFIPASIIIQLNFFLDFKEKFFFELALLNLEMDEEKERKSGIKPTIS